MQMNTNSLLYRQDLEQFESELCKTCGTFGIVAPTGMALLKASLETDRRAGLEFACVAQNADVIFRSDKHIRKDPGNHYFLIIQKRGQSRISQGETCEEMTVGDFFIVDSTRPCRFHYDGKSNMQLSLHLPRDEMNHRFGISIYGGIYVSRKDALSHAMRSIIADLLSNERVGQVHMLEAFYSVLGSFLLNRKLGVESKINPNQNVFNQTLELMARHFRDPEFTPKHAAELIGVSQRQLQRIFKDRENGPQQTLQSLRLDAASELIINNVGNNTDSISSIAYQCGFGDLSTFYRQFKSRHGRTPSECLKRCRDMQ